MISTLLFPEMQFLCCMKLYVNKNNTMQGKTVIITGSNRGIGKVTAEEIARRGARVILACRNLESAEKAKNEIIEETNNCNIVVKKLDLSSQKSIRQFADDVLNLESRLDVLLHNAGVIPKNIQMTEDSIEFAMATNHYGPFLLTHLLIDLLKQSAPSRIIVITSISYILAWLNFYNVNPKTSSWIPSIFPSTIYFSSKYANVCFTRELARRLEGTGVSVNCAHPGLVETDIWDDFPWYSQCIIRPVKRKFFISLNRGSETSVYLACSRDVEGVTGKYFENCKIKRVWGRSKNLTNNRRIWELSEKLINLQAHDPHL